MAQTATIVSTGRNLYIYNEASSFLKTTRDHSEKDLLLELRSLITILETESVFSYKDRLRINFTLASSVRRQFALLRGLIEFYRPTTLLFLYNREHNALEVDLKASEFDVLKIFLRSVSHSLEREINFKTSLKKVLEFEQKAKAEKESVYKSFLAL